MTPVPPNELHRELTATSKHLGLLGDIARRQGWGSVSRDLRAAEDAVDQARAGLYLSHGGKKRHGGDGAYDDPATLRAAGGKRRHAGKGAVTAAQFKRAMRSRKIGV